MANDRAWTKAMTLLGFRGFAGTLDPELKEQVEELQVRLAVVERRLATLERGDK